MIKKAKIIIVGMGGQGVQTIAKILASAAAQSGLNASYIPQFGVEQRGAPSVAFIVLDREKIGYPLFGVADWALIMHPSAVDALAGHIGGKTKIIFDSSLMDVSKIGKKSKEIFGLPVVGLAIGKFSLRAANLIILGKISQLFDLSFDSVWQKIMESLGGKLKSGALKKENREAFLAGYESSLEEKIFSRPSHQPQAGVITFGGVGKKGFLLPENCKSCGICLVKCSIGAIRFGKITGAFAAPLPEIDMGKCTLCGNCSLFCPDGAIKTERTK
jgi:2-oxoglutarate ferredoxin oxidoreductase subunit gamma